MPPQSTTDPIFQQRFFARTTRGASGCLEWQGAKNAHGYGRVMCDGKHQRAHRVAWVLANGAIPDGLGVLHKCDRPACCLVDHLFLGTPADNAHDRDAKGRRQPARGARNGLAKLTDSDVLEIRRVYVRGAREFGQHALARRFGVHHTLIGFIVRREIWAHIPEAD